MSEVIHKYCVNFEKLIGDMINKTKGKWYYKRELQLYQNILNEINNGTYVYKYDTKLEQFFEQNIGELDNPFCTIVWDIQKAQKIIESKKIKPICCEVSKYASQLQNVELSEFKKVMANFNYEPIIIVKWSSHKDIIIDGNHRLYNAVQENKKTINAYVLSIEESMECMLTDNFRMLFKILHNLDAINIHINIPSYCISYYHGYETKDFVLYNLHESRFSYLLSRFLLAIDL